MQPELSARAQSESQRHHFLVSCSADSWDKSKTFEVVRFASMTAIQNRSENPRNRCQARRESSTVAGAGETWSRDRCRVEEGPRVFFGDLTPEAIKGGGAIPCASDLRSHPQMQLGALLRFDSRPACGDATVELAKARQSPAYARLRGHIPEGTLFRPATRTARARNAAWRRFSSGFRPRISGAGH